MLEQMRAASARARWAAARTKARAPIHARSGASRSTIRSCARDRERRVEALPTLPRERVSGVMRASASTSASPATRHRPARRAAQTPPRPGHRVSARARSTIAADASLDRRELGRLARADPLCVVDAHLPMRRRGRRGDEARARRDRGARRLCGAAGGDAAGVVPIPRSRHLYSSGDAPAIGIASAPLSFSRLGASVSDRPARSSPPGALGESLAGADAVQIALLELLEVEQRRWCRAWRTRSSSSSLTWIASRRGSECAGSRRPSANVRSSCP